MIESANYLLEKPMYYELIDGCRATNIDHYADSITLNIVYNLSPNESLKSVLYSKYYGNNGNQETDNLLKTATDDNCMGESQYLRYWHGEMIILKPLLLILNIRQIYILNAIILILLTGVLSYKLCKNKMYAVMIGILVALIATNAYVVPLSLEYISMYLVMLISSIFTLQFIEKNKTKAILPLFFIIGIFTCFFDFLTIETVTLTVPLIILLVYKYKNNNLIDNKEIFKYIIKLIMVWGIGYVLMWITKWGISTIYLNEDIKKVVLENAAQRIERTKVYTVGQSSELSNSVILRNVHCLFPLCFFEGKNIIVFLGAFLLFTFLFLTRKEKNIKLPLIIFTIGLIPYLRYLAINGHSLIHYFFTYRAQFATILAVIVGGYYMVDTKLLRRKNKCKKKKK